MDNKTRLNVIKFLIGHPDCMFLCTLCDLSILNKPVNQSIVPDIHHLMSKWVYSPDVLESIMNNPFEPKTAAELANFGDHIRLIKSLVENESNAWSLHSMLDNELIEYNIKLKSLYNEFYMHLLTIRNYELESELCRGSIYAPTDKLQNYDYWRTVFQRNNVKEIRELDMYVDQGELKFQEHEYPIVYKSGGKLVVYSGENVFNITESVSHIDKYNLQQLMTE